MIKENHIQIKKTARYYQIGEHTNKIKKVIFAIHGFAQLAKDFIKTFEVLEDEDTIIIAPEALNKFYIRGYRGTIGTTWLTQEDRENEILDYVSYLNSVFIKSTEKLKINNCEIIVLGFSQGTHTASRWLSKFQPKVKSFILWGGAFPHEINYETDLDYWNKINLKMLIGSNDKHVSKELIENEKEFIKSQNLKVSLEVYDGKHEIIPNLLKETVKKIYSNE